MKRGHRAHRDGGMSADRIGRLAGAVLVAIALMTGDGRASSSLAGGALEMPMPPPSYVLDAGDVFARHPERLAEISKALRELEKKHGIPVYLAVYSGLLRTSVSRQAKDLLGLWVGDNKDGIVVVCDTDDARVDLGLPKASYYSMNDESLRITRLPESRIVPIVRELKREVDGNADPVDYLPVMTGILTIRLDEVLSIEPTSWLDDSVWKIGMVTVTVGVLLGTLGFWVSRFLKQSEEKARENFHFPDVLVRARLGANFAGGKAAVLYYAGEEEPEDQEEEPQTDE